MEYKYMTTYTGKSFSVFDVDVTQIDIVDIAHALSLLCRGNGHLKHFYSVAQHSINCALEAKACGYSTKLQLACLLHDATEAYLSDLIRPVKQRMPMYSEIEDSLMKVIFERFGIGDMLSDKQWKEIDDQMCLYDLEHLMNIKDFPKAKTVIQPDIKYYEHKVIEERFLKHFNELSNSL